MSALFYRTLCVQLLFFVVISTGWAGIPDLEKDIQGYQYLRTEEHPEFQRYFYKTPSGEKVGIEIVEDDRPPSTWNTGAYRIMPAPQSNPPRELLQAAMAIVKEQESVFFPLPDLTKENIIEEDWNNKPYILAGILLLVFFFLRNTPHKGLLFVSGLFLSLTMLNWQLLPYLDRPFFDDAQTQRLFIGTLPSTDILHHHYPDDRHPPLFFLILSFFLHWSTEEWVARLPALIFGNLSLIGVCLWGREINKTWVGLLAAVLLARHPFFLEQCGQISDVSLFLSLLAFSMTALFRYVDSPQRQTLGLLIVLQTGIIWSYYMGIAVVALQVLYLIRHLHWQKYWLGLPIVVLLSIPELVQFQRLLSADQNMRTVVSSNPDHLWGNETSMSIVLDYINLFSIGSVWPITMLLLGLGIWTGKETPDRRISFHIQLLVLGGLILSIGAPLVRLKVYYALFALPSMCFIVVLGAGSWRARLSVPLLMILALIAVRTPAETTLKNALYPENGSVYSELAKTISSSQRASLIVADAENSYSLLLYYLDTDAVENYPNCTTVPDAAIACFGKTMNIQTLTRLTLLSEGWQQRATSYVQNNISVPYWLMYLPQFENKALLDHAEKECRLEKEWGPSNPLLLYYCDPTS